MQNLNPSTIFYTAEALNARGMQALTSFPEATSEQISQHNRLPAVEGNHFQVKSNVLVLGRLKTMTIRESGRSSDFISPSLANGCLGACA